MMKCPNCNATDHEPNAKYCSVCGAQLINVTGGEQKREITQEEIDRADSLFRKGQDCFRKGNFKEAVPYLLESATLGDSRAQATLSNCYKNGKGVERSDLEAFRWAMASARQNNPWGQVFVGLYYLYGGESIKPDDEQAYLWFKKSADQNFSMGIFYLGQCYYCGVGVTPDTDFAYEYFRKSDYIRAKDIIKGETWPLLTKDKLEEIRKASQTT